MTEPFDDEWVAGDAYEAYMGRWSRPLARAFLEWLRPKHGGHWLDVGCGTGALTAAIVSLCEPASVVGCDPSAAFIEHARKTLRDSRASFIVGGADALPEREVGFDAVVSALVLNFLPDPVDAVARFRARLQPGGIVAASVWDYADGMELLRRFWKAAAALDARAIEMDEGRRFAVCRRESLASLFESAGLTDVVTSSIEIPMVFDAYEELWASFCRGTGPAPSYVESLDETMRASLKARLQEDLPAVDGRPVELRARAWVVRGTAA